MRIGVAFLGSESQNLTRSSLVAGAQAAEGAGFDGLWFFDALGRGHIHPDPLIALTLAASVTQKIEVGTCILQVPLRRPVELAHRVLTAHHLCEGRMAFGVGAGSTKLDFDFSGLDFTTRMQDLSDGLEIMQKVWNDEPVNGHTISPWESAKGGPPILIGSWAGKTWIPRAAQEFDGWIASGAKSTYGKLQEGIVRYRELGGKRAIVTNIQVDLSAPTQELTPDTPFNLRCDPETAKERFATIRDLGYDDAIFVLPNHDAKAMEALLKITGK